MILPLLATLILLTADTTAPNTVVEVNSSHDVLVESEGHPEEIGMSGVLPDSTIIQLAVCDHSSTCSVGITFIYCGFYQLPAYIQYEHGDPGGPGPYVVGVNATVIVVGCELFADDFEDGTTDAWSKIAGG